MVVEWSRSVRIGGVRRRLWTACRIGWSRCRRRVDGESRVGAVRESRCTVWIASAVSEPGSSLARHARIAWRTVLWSRLKSRAISARESGGQLAARYMASWRAWATRGVRLRREQSSAGDAEDGADGLLDRARRSSGVVGGAGPSGRRPARPSARRDERRRDGLAEHGGERRSRGSSRPRAGGRCPGTRDGDLPQHRRVGQLGARARRPSATAARCGCAGRARSSSTRKPQSKRSRSRSASRASASGGRSLERTICLPAAWRALKVWTNSSSVCSLPSSDLDVVDQQRVELAVALLEALRARPCGARRRTRS